MVPLKSMTSLTLSAAWAQLKHVPLGKQLFSKLISLKIPYSGTIQPQVLELSDGHAVVRMADRRAVRNHLDCIHAIALINLGELTTGLAMFHRLDGRAKGIVTDLRIEYAKKSRGPITATCDAVVPEVTGPLEMVVEGNLRDKAGDTVAKVWATWALKP